MLNYTRGEKRAEGKTKIIWSIQGRPDLVIVESKDDITAGDGARHDVVSGKGALANQITCDVFRLLQQRGVPLAFLEQVDATSFLARHTDMLPWEVVARGKAWGSYLKRHPEQSEGRIFGSPLVEFFLKTTGREFEGHQLPEDDPFAIISDDGRVDLYLSKKPMLQQAAPFLTLHKVFGWDRRDDMAAATRSTFEGLQAAWRKLNGDLIDFKVEYGIDADGRCLLSDVIDTESWRLLGPNGKHLDKQPYRDGADPTEVVQARYGYAATLTSQLVD